MEQTFLQTTPTAPSAAVQKPSIGLRTLWVVLGWVPGLMIAGGFYAAGAIRDSQGAALMEMNAASIALADASQRLSVASPDQKPAIIEQGNAAAERSRAARARANDIPTWAAPTAAGIGGAGGVLAGIVLVTIAVAKDAKK